jgi:hypothetical protein
MSLPVEIVPLCPSVEDDTAFVILSILRGSWFFLFVVLSKTVVPRLNLNYSTK